MSRANLRFSNSSFSPTIDYLELHLLSLIEGDLCIGGNLTDTKTINFTQSFYNKLLMAKSEFDPVLKNKSNPHFKSSYADLGAILDAVEPALHKNGLLLVQPSRGTQVTTQIIDCESGEVMESYLEIPEGLDPQKTGAAISYYRRFTLQSLLALHAEDDDGNATVRPEPYKATQPVPSHKGVSVPPPKLSNVLKEKVDTYMPQTTTSNNKVWPSNGNSSKKPARYSAYVIGFGKHKDRTLGEMGVEALGNYIDWLQRNAEDRKQPLNPHAIELIMRAKDHLADMAGNTQTDLNPPPHNDSDIPF